MPIFLSDPKNTNANNNLVSNSISLGSPTNVDAFYVVGSGFAAIAWTGFASANHSNLNNISTTYLGEGYDGKRYAFYRFKDKTGGAKTLTFTPLAGQTVSIETLYLMEILFEFPDDDTFVKIDMDSRERGAIIHEDLYGEYTKVQGKFKRRVEYTAEYQTRKTYREFDLFRRANPNFYFLEDMYYYPERLYKAMLGRDVKTNYTTPYKGRNYDLDPGTDESYQVLNIDFTITER